mgnify:CR=1 FL=1
MATTNTKKITSVSALTSAIEALTGTTFPAEKLEKLESIKAAYEKKTENAKSKSSAKSAENTIMGEKIVAEMEQGTNYTLSDIAKFDCLSDMELTTAKVRALIEAPVNAGTLEKGSIKGRMYYWLA